MKKAKTIATMITVVIAVLVIIGVRMLTSSDSNTPSAPEATPAPTGISDGSDPEGQTCTRLNVLASSEKAELLKTIATTYNSSAQANDVNGACGRVDITSLASGAALDALSVSEWDTKIGPLPDVWSPASTSWVRLLNITRSTNDLPEIAEMNSDSIANSPLVIAMPKPMAESLGWPDAELGWSDILNLSLNDEGWGSVGHPEWGAFKLGKTNPNFSTSGLNATVGSYFAATGLSSDLTTTLLTEPATVDFVKGVESSVVHYGDTTLTFLSNLQKAANEGKALSYISAVTVEEKSVWDYNQGNPTGNPATLGDEPAPAVPLVAIYPKEGTLISDNPFVNMTGSWVTKEKNDVADSFYSFLITPEQQNNFTAAGFRDFENNAGSEITQENGLISTLPTTIISAPSSEVLRDIKNSWTDHRKKANVSIVIDVSGSMGESAGTGVSKLDLAKTAAINSLDDFGPEDEVSLSIFSTERDTVNNLPYLELVPAGPMSTNSDLIKERIANLTPDGGTALYATARASMKAMSENLDPSKINAVVLLTDGRNEYPSDSDVDNLIETLKSSSEKDGVRLFTIGYGSDADLPTLKLISDATRATSYDASNPESIDSVFTAVISNF